jgi:hypothetical protein
MWRRLSDTAGMTSARLRAAGLLALAALLSLAPAAVRGYPELLLAIGGPTWAGALALSAADRPVGTRWPFGLVYALVGWTLLGLTSLWVGIDVDRISALVILAILLALPMAARGRLTTVTPEHAKRRPEKTLTL